MIRAVIFDMDGLLIDSEPIWREAEKDVFATVGIELSDEMCFKTVGLRIEEVVEFWRRQYPWTNRSNEEVKNDINKKVIELILQKGNALPGVEKLMQFFAGKNIPMAIASGSYYEIIDAVVKKLNLQSFLKVIHSAEEETHGKPHPAVFLHAAKKLDIPVWECLVFEDSFNGIIAAKAARMKVVAVPEDIHRGKMYFHAADLILHDLNAFTEKEWELLQ
jgi:sugar-phosphatase